MEEKISIIIPTLGRQPYLKNCITALLSQTVLPDEILVVINTNVDDVMKMIQDHFMNITVNIIPVIVKESGAPYCRNAGIKMAKYNNLVFIDDDCVADKKWLSYMINTLNQHPGSIIQGKTIDGLPGNICSSVECYLSNRVFVSSQYIKNNVTYRTRLDSKHFAVKKQILVQYKIKFDPLFAPFSIYEDIDLGLQSSKAGVQIIYISKAKVMHFGRKQLSDYLKRQYIKGRALFYFKMKWKGANKKIELYEDNLTNKLLYEAKKQRKDIMTKNIQMLRHEVLLNSSRSFKIFFNMLETVTFIVIKTGYYTELCISFVHRYQKAVDIFFLFVNRKFHKHTRIYK